MSEITNHPSIQEAGPNGSRQSFLGRAIAIAKEIRDQWRLNTAEAELEAMLIFPAGYNSEVVDKAVVYQFSHGENWASLSSNSNFSDGSTITTTASFTYGEAGEAADLEASVTRTGDYGVDVIRVLPRDYMPRDQIPQAMTPAEVQTFVAEAKKKLKK